TPNQGPSTTPPPRFREGSTYSPDYDYEIETPSGRFVNPPQRKCWRVSRCRFDELVADNRIWFGKSGSNVPSIKRFLSEVKQGVTPLTVWTYQDVGHTQSGTQMLNDIGLAFENPKPTTLLERMIYIASDPHAIVLDSFAGSGTTAQAVLALNKQDGGNRKFILVECEDYADSITAERVRRVISGVPDVKDADLSEGLGGSFTYCTLGDPITASGMLYGDTLPDFSTLAAWLMHTSTGRSVGPSELQPLDGNGLIYSDSRRNYYLRYKPDLEWLRSNEAVLTESRAEKIGQICRKQNKEAVVFAAGKYIELDDLSELKIMFGQLPFEISRSEQV
ncbi:MAG: site-specific DNA-methyltransferase, partial [Acidimicrobiaceae bacterium]|nr:site-specific DNA-methyltransferase [Acidimicrobiaceae bacterium]MYD08113.1 site-specific DNA-methyltransferase [Acidimicrobiaceae bacterium]MYI60052.1 site-specific DNA-methyltransferase [Acidimicrobiaceae bacterium]